MIYVLCGCGSGVAVPEDFIGTLGECPDCRRVFRVVAGAGTKTISTDELDARLNVRSGPQRVGEQLLLRGEAAVEVGKLPGKPIELAGNLVSRNHCKLIRTASGWRIEDQKSTNGLFVNGKPVAMADLKKGDCVRIGEYEFEYTTSEPDAPALDELQDIYEMAEEPTTVRLAPSTVRQLVTEPLPGPGSVACPSCGKPHPANSKICVDCGIDIRTGRALLVSSDVDEEAVHDTTRSAIRWISWFIPFGLYPVKSEGYGNFKPYAVWSIAALTTVITVCVWISSLSSPDRDNSTKNLLMWTGREPTAADIERGRELSQFTHWGDPVAYDRRLAELKARNMPDEEAEVKAYNELGPEQQFFGEFHWYQLITNGFLHQGILHIAGNLLFLLVFGTRVNALIGQWRTALLYPILLVIASMSELLSLTGKAPLAALGASGAIMGLAGMYFVLFPVHRVFMVIWLRLGLLTGFRMLCKTFAIRGFWVVLFFIAFDVLATALGSKDGVAHWAHLGGFIGGMVLALILLVTRQVDAKGGDLLSAMLGRRAWAILGKPGERQQRVEAEAAVA